MKDIISTLKNPEQCATLEKNAAERGNHDLALAAKKRGIELRAQAYGAKTDAERECLEAVYAYERVLSEKSGKNKRAQRTWQMITRHGTIGAVERAVNRKAETSGYQTLVEMGLGQYAFEAVVLRYPTLFSLEAVDHSHVRINALNK